MKAPVILVAALALAGCKGKDKDKDTAKSEPKGTGTGTGTASAAAIDATPPPPVVKLPDALPASTHAIALEAGVKVFATVDAKGGLALGLVPADRKTAWPAPTPVPSLDAFDAIWRDLRDGLANGEAADALGKRLVVAPPGPPPPPPADAGAPETLDEPGMRLDEGKMGRRSPLERAREVHHGAVFVSDLTYAGLGNDGPPADVVATDRTATTGKPYDGADDDHLAIVVLADGAGEARALIPVLDHAGECALGVRDATGGVARSIVRFGFQLSSDPWSEPSELLVDLADGGVSVRSGPGETYGAAAWTGDAVDAAALGTAYQAAVAGTDRHDVIITVAAGVSVARLVAVADALVDAGADELVVRNWTRPVLHGPVITVERPDVADGELADGPIRAAITAQGAAIKQCYLEALQADPALAGDAMVAVVLADGGAVKDVVVQTKLPVGDCTKAAFRALALTTGDGKTAAFSVPLRYRMLP